MHDAAYKLLFSRPRMVRDLLDGFAARDWSSALDFESLAPLPASFVGRELQQRHGDLIWRVRFRGDRWLYLVLLLEFQATVEPAMAVRILESRSTPTKTHVNRARPGPVSLTCLLSMTYGIGSRSLNPPSKNLRGVKCGSRPPAHDVGSMWERGGARSSGASHSPPTSA